MGLSVRYFVGEAQVLDPPCGTYLLARLLIVVSRSVDSLIWALPFIIIVGPGSLAGPLAVGVRSLGFVAKLFLDPAPARLSPTRRPLLPYRVSMGLRWGQRCSTTMR